MALTSLIQKSSTGDPRWLTSRQALHHATLQSARAVGLGEHVGSLAPGRRADLVLVGLTGPHTQPVHDLPATLVHSARSSDVAAVADELTARLSALVDRSHGRRIQEYDT